jgi:predicted deacylase
VREGRALEAGTLPPRVLGEVGASEPGTGRPTLVVVAGIHGNEPAGVEAVRRLLPALKGREDRMRGRAIFLVGNRRALAEGARYLERDLNRAWTPSRVDALRNGHPFPEDGRPTVEDEEQRELLAVLDAILAGAPGPVYVLDLHTTSAAAGVFTTVGDTLENRALALALPVPLVLGLEEMVEGTLQDHLENRGVVAIAFESGQHVEPDAVERAEAAIWILLEATGLFQGRDLPEAGAARIRLALDGRNLPRSLEIRYRHPAAPEEAFRMDPGWVNFAPVRKGEVVARDRRGPVPVPASGRLLMPLYQPLGEDGFFLVREFRPAWLLLSRLLRQARVDRVVHWFPGIRRDRKRPDRLVLNKRVARWYALQLLHLLGFRRHREEGERLVVLRRGSRTVPGP